MHFERRNSNVKHFKRTRNNGGEGRRKKEPESENEKEEEEEVEKTFLKKIYSLEE